MRPTLYIAAFWIAGSLFAGPIPQRQLVNSLEIPHPPCEASTSLAIQWEKFGPVANDLPGVREYNHMVKLATQRDWRLFDVEYESFRKTYESSPLLEAAAFLLIQTRLAQVSEKVMDDIRVPERMLREASLLYPKSTLIPTVSASVANYWMEAGQYHRSLSLYQSLREDYPFDELYCVFQMGIAESLYNLRDLKAAQLSYQQLMQKCQNPRLRVGAQIRLAHLAWDANAKGFREQYESIYRKSPDTYIRFYPAEVYNLGEILYRDKEYIRAKHYFEEYLNSKKMDPFCASFARKRMADISSHQNNKNESIVGLYLVAKDAAPHTDAGILSGIRALTLEIDKVSEVERERRLKYIDETLDKIKEENYRTAAYLEKGLVLLNQGVPGALDYLARLKDRSRVDIDKIGLSNFVRDRMAEIIDYYANQKEADIDEMDSLIVGIENTYENWLKSGKYARSAAKDYRKLWVGRMEATLLSETPEEAFSWMERAVEVGIIDLANLPEADKKRLAKAFLQSLNQSKKKPELAKTYLSHKKELTDLLGGEVAPVLVIAATETQDQKELKTLTQSGVMRKVSAMTREMPRESQDYFALKQIQALMKAEKYSEAEALVLNQKNLKPSEELIQVVQELTEKTKHYKVGYDLLSRYWDKYEPPQKKTALFALLDIAENGKLWTNSKELLKRAESVEMDDKSSAPFYYLSGRDGFENSNCKDSVPKYEIAISRDPDFRENLASRYRMGKCLLKLKKKEQARKVWEDLSARRDSFWSPLAKNEIKLLNP